MNTRNPEMQDIDQEIVFVVTVVINSSIPIYSTINYQFVWYIHHSGYKKITPTQACNRKFNSDNVLKSRVQNLFFFSL